MLGTEFKKQQYFKAAQNSITNKILVTNEPLQCKALTLAAL